MNANDGLQAKATCDQCGSEQVSLTTNAAVYGREYGDWPHIYLCLRCRAWVSTERGTTTPRGKMVGNDGHQARSRAHAAFDPIWRDRKIMSRKDAYAWLAEQMHMTAEECHIGLMGVSECESVVAFSLAKLRRG